MVATIILSIAVVILAEAVGVLAYAVYKMRKQLKETISNLDNLADCTLRLAKHTAGVEIVEGDADTITFPNDEGF